MKLMNGMLMFIRRGREVVDHPVDELETLLGLLDKLQKFFIGDFAAACSVLRRMLPNQLVRNTPWSKGSDVPAVLGHDNLFAGLGELQIFAEIVLHFRG